MARIEQVDRRIAATFWRQWQSPSHQEFADAIERGERDDCEAVQCAALGREQAIAAKPAGGEGLEADAMVDRIMAMSNEEIMRHTTPSDVESSASIVRQAVKIAELKLLLGRTLPYLSSDFGVTQDIRAALQTIGEDKA